MDLQLYSQSDYSFAVVTLNTNIDTPQIHVINTISSPSQVRPSLLRANPRLQVQANPPAVFTHVCWQLSVLS